MPSPTTPSATSQSAPPNFYSQAGQMAAQGPAAGGVAGAGGAAAAGGAGQPGGGKDQDHQFLDMTTKLLSVIQKMQDMKPRGQDVSKELQAAADAVKQAVSKVFGKDGLSGDGGSTDQADGTDAGAGQDAGAAAGGGGGSPDTGATA